MDPCILTKTGTNFLPLILLGAVLVLLASGLVFYRRKPGVALFAAALVFSAGISLTSLAPVVDAQALPNECVPGGQDDEDDDTQTPVVLGLHDDAGHLQLPDADTQWSSGHIAILENDNPPESDPYDWQTIDLDVDEAGLQSSFRPVHPDDDSYFCGYIDAVEFGVLLVELHYLCEDEDFNTLQIPDDYSVPAFQYTVQTLGGEPAPEPANVTITTQTEPITPGVVTAVEDNFTYVCLSDEPSGLDILSNDSTTVGTLDPLSIDIDLSKPGRQKSVTTTDGYVVSVDSSGNLSVVAPPDAFVYDFFRLFYRVSNSNGDVSNLGLAIFGCPGNA